MSDSWCDVLVWNSSVCRLETNDRFPLLFLWLKRLKFDTFVLVLGIIYVELILYKINNYERIYIGNLRHRGFPSCLWHIGERGYGGCDADFSFLRIAFGCLSHSGFGSQWLPPESRGSKHRYQKIRFLSALSALHLKHRKVRRNPRCCKFLIKSTYKYMMWTFRRMARRLRGSEATFGEFESNFAPSRLGV